MFNWFKKKTDNEKQNEPIVNAEPNASEQKKKTKTGMTASALKNKKLKTRQEMKKLRAKLPQDFRNISVGTFAEMSEITDHLFLTGIFGLTQENFDGNKITNVVNVSYEAPDLQIKGISYTRVLVDDDPSEDLLPFFNTISDNIESVAKKNGNTVVHCVAGVSRSSALVLAYLVKYKNMTLKQAFRHVMDRRKCIKPICGFIEQLIEFEKQIRGTNSCRMIRCKREGIVVSVPDFWPKEYPFLLNLEIELEKQKLADMAPEGQGQADNSYSSSQQ